MPGVKIQCVPLAHCQLPDAPKAVEAATIHASKMRLSRRIALSVPQTPRTCGDTPSALITGYVRTRAARSQNVILRRLSFQPGRTNVSRSGTPFSHVVSYNHLFICLRRDGEATPPGTSAVGIDEK